MSDKTTTVRLPEDMHKTLRWVAYVDNTTVSDVIRKAIDEYIIRHSQDELFPDQVAAMLEKDRIIAGRIIGRR